MHDSNIKPVPYGVTKAQVKRQREYNTEPTGQAKSGLFNGVRRLFK